METTSARSTGSSTNGTDDREACPKHWYAAYVQMNCERKSAAKLNALGIDIFIPTQTEVHHWSDRKKKVERLVIPMMVFLFIEESKIKKVKELSFVRTFLSAPGSKCPVQIPEEQINQFKYMLSNAEDTISIEPCLHKGDSVVVINGVLKGLKGVVCICNDNQRKIGVSIDYLGYACVSIDRNDIETTK